MSGSLLAVHDMYDEVIDWPMSFPMITFDLGNSWQLGTGNESSIPRKEKNLGPWRVFFYIIPFDSHCNLQICSLTAQFDEEEDI